MNIRFPVPEKLENAFNHSAVKNLPHDLEQFGSTSGDYLLKLFFLANLIDPAGPEGSGSAKQVNVQTRAFENAVRDQLVLMRIREAEEENAKTRFTEAFPDWPSSEDLKKSEVLGTIDDVLKSNAFVRFVLPILFDDPDLSRTQECISKLFEAQKTDCEVSSDALCFVCFYVICTFLRRKGQHQILNIFISDEGGSRGYTDKQSFYHNVFEHIRLESLPQDEITKNELNDAKELLNNMDQAGVIMMYANMVYLYISGNKDAWDDETEKHYNNALKGLNERKPDLLDYPKTHIIKAQLLSLKGKYPEALQSAKQGIALQKKREKDSDYMARLTEFYDISVTMEVEEQVSRITKMSQDLQDKFDKQQTKNIELLSIFSALIGLILGGISVSVSFNSAGDAIRVLLALFGAVTVTFTLFYAFTHWSVNLRNGSKLKTVFYILGIILMLAVGIGMLYVAARSCLIV